MLKVHLLLLLTLFFAPWLQTAEPQPPLTHEPPEYTFGDKLHIRGTIDPAHQVEQIIVF
jgi:hypothetical protein